MYIIIVGGGDVTDYLTRLLLAEKHDVVIIESDVERAKTLSEKLDALVIQGDGSSLDVLKEAGIEKANALLALTSDDNSNLMICQQAKSFEVSNIVAKINNPQKEEIFIKAGIESTVSPTAAVVTSIKNALSPPSGHTLGVFGGGALEIFEVLVSEKSRSLGKKIRDLKLPKTARVLAMYHNGETKVCKGNEKLVTGDVLLVVSGKGHVTKVINKLAGG